MMLDQPRWVEAIGFTSCVVVARTPLICVVVSGSNQRVFDRVRSRATPGRQRWGYWPFHRSDEAPTWAEG